MKTLHLYLIRQVLATLMMTVLVFTFVLLLGNGIRSILPMLVNHQASLGLALKAVILLIPFVLSFALPMGMLTAALLVFGRFSADQELIAVRASGVSLVSLVTPILALSALLSVFCAWLNCDLAPRCKVAFNRAIYGAPVMINPSRLITSGQYTTIGQFTIFVEKVARDGVHLENVRISKTDSNGDLEMWAQAPRGTVVANPTNNYEVILTLQDTYLAYRKKAWFEPSHSGGEVSYPFDFRPKANDSDEDIQMSDMTFRQLWKRLDQVESIGLMPSPSKEQTPEAFQQAKSLKLDATSILVNLHRQVSYSFACIGFTLVGIPLGIRTHRRETSVGMAMALVLVAIYFSFLILGDAWAAHPERAPHLIVWLPNFVFQAVGCVLLFRANRQG